VGEAEQLKADNAALRTTLQLFPRGDASPMQRLYEKYQSDLAELQLVLRPCRLASLRYNAMAQRFRVMLPTPIMLCCNAIGPHRSATPQYHAAALPTIVAGRVCLVCFTKGKGVPQWECCRPSSI
jgi:hypothetical protein